MQNNFSKFKKKNVNKSLKQDFQNQSVQKPKQIHASVNKYTMKPDLSPKLYANMLP